jgi:surface protein
MADNINIQVINPNNFEFQEYNSDDLNLITAQEIETSFDPNLDYIEYYVYDLSNSILTSNIFGFPNYKLINNQVSISPVEDLASLGYEQGSYNTLYNFLKRKLGSNPFSTYYIDEISPDRTEIRLNTTEISDIEVVTLTNEFITEIQNTNSDYVDFYLNFGDNQLIIANNILLDNSDPTDPTILIKLYEPLPSQFSLKTQCWVVEKIAQSIAYNISITPSFDDTDEFIYLKGPNFNLPFNNQINNSTEYSNYQTLTSTSPTLSQGTGSLNYQLNNILSQTGIDINVDYSDYSNFIHFSSAQTRLENFYYKLQLLEEYTYSASLSSNPSSGSYYVSSSNIIWQSKINETITSFDSYEYFLYYGSGSASWPKTGNTPPYTNVLTSSPAGISWFASQYLTAEEYDIENNNALVLAIPGYILEDPANSQYELFIEMIGQMFDNIFIYLQGVTSKYDADNRLNYGVSKDLVADILKDMGVNLYQNNFSSNDVYQALIGITPSGSLYNLPYTTTQYPVPSGSFLDYITTYVTASSTSSLYPTDDINKEQYKRIYHNLPLLLKKKGSISGLKDLITVFGIPDTILRVNEFGGKDKNPNTWDYWQNEYDYTFSTSGSGFVSAPWDGAEFISLWRTSNTSVGSSTSTQVTLPLVNTGTYNMLVDWGDGTQDTITIWNQAQRTHTYANAGDYTITISGTCRGFRFAGGGDRLKLLNISQYGVLNLSTDSAFYFCTNFNSTATDAPIISTTSLVDTFRDCSNFNGNIGNWDVSNITNMQQMFLNAVSFNNNGNSSINNWNTSKVTNMLQMFREAREFDQNIGGWDVSNVILMNGAGTGLFIGTNMKFNNGGNPSINNWDISKITLLQDMFNGCFRFNQPLSNWNTSNVTNMDRTFGNCLLFNQNLSNWDTTKVTRMAGLFASCREFNNDGDSNINNWNTSNVVDMSQMFFDARKFNQPLNNWNTSKVTNMIQMFFQTFIFNQPLNNWNTSLVTNMIGMFRSSTLFNQDISSWNISNVTTMGSSNNGMFINASSFNQNLGAWNLRTAGVSLQEIFTSSGMSCQNYTDTIVGWANKVQTNSNTPINVNMANQGGRRFDGTRSGGAGFASATAARLYLTTATPTGAGWTISGDTLGGC